MNMSMAHYSFDTERELLSIRYDPNFLLMFWELLNMDFSSLSASPFWDIGYLGASMTLDQQLNLF